MKRNFEIVELGTTYKLPKYRVIDGKGIVELNSDNVLPASLSEQTITFVRGDKTDNGEVIPRVDGVYMNNYLL